MSLSSTIKQYVQNFKAYLDAEVALVKYQLVKKVGNFMGLVFSAIYVMLLLHFTMAIAGIWLGLWLGEMLGSYTQGFGVTALLYLVWLICCIVFRHTLLVKPFSKLVVASLIEQEERIKNEEESEK
jgi:fatty acid desaturase